MRTLFFVVFCLLSSHSTRAQSWYNLRNGADALNANGPICTVCTDTQGNVYAAGMFADSSHLPLGKAYVAKWDAVHKGWSELGTGAGKLNANFTISTICTSNQLNVYAAGGFTDSATYMYGHKYVAKWNGTTWQRLGTGSSALSVGGWINTICADRCGGVYAAGTFYGSSGYRYVAYWNGIFWSELGNLSANDNIISICADNSCNVYAAGIFTNSLGHPYVAKYSPITGNWQQLDTGFHIPGCAAQINSIFSDSAGEVCAAVSFYNSTMTIANVYRWRGGHWMQVGVLNANSVILTSCSGVNGKIYVAGDFNNTGENYVAEYDRTCDCWTELGTVSNLFKKHLSYLPLSRIRSICTDRKGVIYAGGDFSDSVSPIAIYNFVATYGNPPASLTASSHSSTQLYTYPNPASGQITVTGLPISPIAYNLLSNNGRVVASGYLSNQSKTIDVHHLKPGLYYLVADGSRADVVVK